MLFARTKKTEIFRESPVLSSNQAAELLQQMRRTRQ